MDMASNNSKAERLSNIELLRIVAMLTIVAHHYVVNSHVAKSFDLADPSCSAIFLWLWGMWGKTAINVFVLITGYFMSTGRLTARRYLKILLEIAFYAWVIWLVLCAAGYETLSVRATAKRLFLWGLLTNQDNGFVPAFMWMYLLIPAMNVYVRSASRHNLYLTIAVLLSMFTICGTFFRANVYHHVFWYCALYFVAAAIRIHPFAWMNRNRVCVPLFISSAGLGWASVIGIVANNARLNNYTLHPYFFVADSNKILAFAVSLFAFLIFKNWRIPKSRFINTVASTTFGVLLIHSASDGMRKWLWKDLVNVSGAYSSLALPTLIGYSVAVTLGVFAACSALDYLRIRFVEGRLLSIFSHFLTCQNNH